jgi:hypothetical protein
VRYRRDGLCGPRSRVLTAAARQRQTQQLYIPKLRTQVSARLRSFLSRSLSSPAPLCLEPRAAQRSSAHRSLACKETRRKPVPQRRRQAPLAASPSTRGPKANDGCASLSFCPSGALGPGQRGSWSWRWLLKAGKQAPKNGGQSKANVRPLDISEWLHGCFPHKIELRCPATNTF